MFAFADLGRAEPGACCSRAIASVSSRSITPNRAEGGLVFGSEIKSILQDPAVGRAWSPEALDAYLTLLYVPAPATIYRSRCGNCRRATFSSPTQSGVRVTRYWDLEFTGSGDPANEQQYLEELEALLTESVRMRLISEVPLGAFLSGGIDSTDGRRLHDGRRATPKFSRPRLASPTRRSTSSTRRRRIADHLGCRLETTLVAPRVDELLPRLAWHLDEPFGDSSAVPTYCVSAAARERVTVALSGDGGDELWAGYPWHRVELWEWQARERLGPAGCDLASRLGHLLPLSAKGRPVAPPPGVAAGPCVRAQAWLSAVRRDRRNAHSIPAISRRRSAVPIRSRRSVGHTPPASRPTHWIARCMSTSRRISRTTS